MLEIRPKERMHLSTSINENENTIELWNGYNDNKKYLPTYTLITQTSAVGVGHIHFDPRSTR